MHLKNIQKGRTFVNDQLILPMMGRVLLLIDWDNLYYGLFQRFGHLDMHIGERIVALMEWVEEIGGLMGGRGFIFAPEHVSAEYQRMFNENRLQLVICPKRKLKTPRADFLGGEPRTEEDTVDETIIWFAKNMAGHPSFKILCLVSGDNDYVPMFEEMGRLGIKRALAPPAIASLAKNKRLLNLTDRNPVTQKRMILLLERAKIAV
jgi:hypothetical protein